MNETFKSTKKTLRKTQNFIDKMFKLWNIFLQFEWSWRVIQFFQNLDVELESFEFNQYE